MGQGLGPGVGDAAATVTVKISGSKGLRYVARLQPDGQPMQARKAGPDWSYDLAPGTYFFHVAISGVAGVKATFTVSGAKAETDLSIVLPGVPGPVVDYPFDIQLTV